jgi:hypothetical protein
VDLDGRHLIHAQDLVGIKVGLLDAAVFQRDLAIERRRDAEDDRALDLRPDDVGIDDGIAIDRAEDAPDTNGSVPPQFDFSKCSVRAGAARPSAPDGSADEPAGSAIPAKNPAPITTALPRVGIWHLQLLGLGVSMQRTFVSRGTDDFPAHLHHRRRQKRLGRQFFGVTGIGGASCPLPEREQERPRLLCNEAQAPTSTGRSRTHSALTRSSSSLLPGGPPRRRRVLFRSSRFRPVTTTVLPCHGNRHLTRSRNLTAVGSCEERRQGGRHVPNHAPTVASSVLH